MAISNVKSSLLLDLATITTTNGYNTTVKTVYGIPRFPNQVDATACPAVCCYLAGATGKQFDEATRGFDLGFAVTIHVTVNDDIDLSGDMESALFKLYEDIVNLFNLQTTNTYKLDEVESIEVSEFFLETSGNKGWASMIIKIGYK